MARRILAAGAAAAALAYAGGASALTVWTQSPNFAEMLYNTNVATAQDNFNTVSKPGGFLVNWDSQTSTKLIQSGAGAGHAWIAGEGGAGVQDILITPVADPLDGHPDLYGFTEFGVKIDFLSPTITVPDPKRNDPNHTKDVNAQSENFQATFTFSIGGPLTITLPGPLLGTNDFPSSGQFNFASDPGTEGYITSIRFFNVNYFSDKNQGGTEAFNLGFADFKQPSFDAVPLGTGVPEPASWAMMLTGFGGLGAMLRRRKAAAAVA